MSRPIDIVIPVGATCDWGEYEELRYALRSACMYVEGLRNVYLVGHRPVWAKGVIHLPMDDLHTSNKDANLIDKVLKVCALSALSDKFIRMSDDQYFLKPWKLEEHSKPLAYGDLVTDGILWKGDTAKKYHQKIARTRDQLLKLRKGTWFYDTHSPAVYNKLLYPKAMAQVDYVQPPGFTINTIYYNLIGAKPCGRGLFEMRYELPNAQNLADIRAKCADVAFLNNTPEGVCDGLKQYLQERFTDKCKFES